MQQRNIKLNTIKKKKKITYNIVRKHRNNKLETKLIKLI